MIAGIDLWSAVVVLTLAAGGYLAVALVLIASQRPWSPARTPALDFDVLDFNAPGGGPAPTRLDTVLARDGMQIRIRRYEGGGRGKPLLIAVHGSGWHGGGYHDLAKAIAASGAAEVVVPDLRGHGVDPLRRGDIDHIGQLEEDLFDVIEACRGARGREVCMLGHSSGGGLVVRFAGGVHGKMLSKAVLVAPFLKYDAPTTRPRSGGWARPLVRRIIGLGMLNRVGISALNGLEAISFAFPQAVLDGPEGGLATPRYSYRMNVSFAPRRDYLRDMAALPEFLVIVGADDAAFVPEAYEPLMSPVNSKGRYCVLPGQGHLGITRSPEAARIAADFLKR